MFIKSKYCTLIILKTTMRPDQHKKKRTEQYKKKHGMNLNKNARTDKRNDESASNAGKNDHRQKNVNSISSHNTVSQSLEDNVANDDSEIYSKRTLHSNWEKYNDEESL